MATLINSTEDLKKYVTVNDLVTWENPKPYAAQAERKYLIPILGDELYTSFVAAAPSEPTPLKVYELAREASANLLWFLYLPLANVQITDAGIAVAHGDDHKSAEWWQIRDLRRSFIDAGFTALDEALRIMESNEDDFDTWVDTDGYTIIKELFVKNTSDFNRWFNINNNRRTFLALRPYMLEVHHQYFTAQLNAETLAAIILTAKPKPTLSEELEVGVVYMVLDLLQAAQVNYTVAKAIKSGTFELTSNGIYQKMEEFPGYKTQTLDETQLQRIYGERLTAGEEYYKKALKLIAANPTEYSDYEAPDTGTFVKPHDTKSIVSF